MFLPKASKAFQSRISEMSHVKYMVSGEREMSWADIVDYARSREFSGAPELGELRGPKEASVMDPMDGVYHRVAPTASRGVGKKEAVFYGGGEEQGKDKKGGEREKSRGKGVGGGQGGRRGPPVQTKKEIAHSVMR